MIIFMKMYQQLRREFFVDSAREVFPSLRGEPKMLEVMTKGCLALTLLTAAPLYAHATSDEVPSRTVSYSEYDLTTPAGDEKLYKRIREAAREVCHGLEGRDLHTVRLHHDCVDSAIGRAVVQVNHPQFTAYYAAHSRGKPLPAASILRKPNGLLRVSKR